MSICVCSEEVGNGLSLGEELIGRLLHGVDGQFVVHVKSLNDAEFATAGGDWE